MSTLAHLVFSKCITFKLLGYLFPILTFDLRIFRKSFLKADCDQRYDNPPFKKYRFSVFSVSFFSQFLTYWTISQLLGIAKKVILIICSCIDPS